jgi:two-component system, response regulator PdtaR
MYVVVIAEDEPLIRMAAAQILVDEGFQVREAEHAAEAIAILKVEARNVHVLFTDVRMPGDMDGLALSHHVKMNWPWIGLLVTSAQALLAEHELPKGGRFLPKPYKYDRLVGHIRDLVEAE